MGDGCRNNEMNSHYTSSEKFSNDLQRLIFLSGCASHIGIRQPRTSVMKDGRIVTGKYPEFRVSARERLNLSVYKKKEIKTEQYNGKIYNIRMKSFNTLVIRRGLNISVFGSYIG